MSKKWSASVRRQENLESQNTKTEEEDVVDQGHKVSENPVILEEILKNLEVRDLLSCSLVNKVWNYEARSVLRDHKKCLAVVNTRTHKLCSCVPELNEILRSCRHCPFNGLSLSVNNEGQERHEIVGCNEKSEPWDVILDKVVLKYLKIDYRSYDEEFLSACHAMRFFKLILTTRLEQVEELHVVNFGHHRIPGMGHPRNYSSLIVLKDDVHLPRLRLLKLHAEPLSNEPAVFKKLMSGAPNLKEFHCFQSNPTLILDVVPKRLYRTIKKISFHAFNDALKDFYLELAHAQPQLHHLHIPTPLGRDRSRVAELGLAGLVNWPAILESICTSSSNSLLELRCDFHVLQTLMANCPDFPKFSDLEVLKLWIDATVCSTSLVGAFDFFSLFPRLTSASVMFMRPQTLGALFPQPELDAANAGNIVEQSKWAANSAVRSLKLHSMQMSMKEIREGIQFFGDLFPNLEVLNIEPYHVNPFLPIDQIWKSMPSLRSLNVKQGECANINIRDAEFCGIHPEEAAWLREKSPEFIRDYHAVPIKPALTHLKKLQHLHVDLLTGGNPKRKRYLSRVTAGLVFARLPNLKITVRCRETHKGLLTEIQEFVNVTTARFRNHRT